ncbi:hypothetical protein AB0E08_07720 [Streptomyces sp. NPDC048281]|uniref:hypothetical protein n=1 Tax=Streptomyces sp. NPDC048281 TaxID=3154715 RepID=UPI00341713ED
MTTEDTDHYRYADREGEGWIRNGPGDTYTTHPRYDLAPLTKADLETQRGPLRPIGLMGQGESARLAEALAGAGKKGLATFLVALHRTALTLIDDGASTAVFTAGRPGSWEAADLRQALRLGDDIADSRIDRAALETARELLLKWVTGPVQPELGDGLASILGDAAEKAGSWAAITDEWLEGNDLIEHWTSAYRQSFNPTTGVAEF